MSNNTGHQNGSLSFTKKVWITAGIFSLVIACLLLIKTMFALLLLVFAAVLMAIYFHACASLLHKYLHLPPQLSLIFSVIINVLLLVGFFWFVGARLAQQASELSEKIPQSLVHARAYLQQNVVGSRLLEYLHQSGNSNKTMTIAKSFLSSGFGLLSDVYIIVLLGLFFTASPQLYKRGIVHLLPVSAKKTGNELLNELAIVLKKWLAGQIIGFFFIAILSGIGLWILGIPLVLTLALIAGLLNFIPNFGPIIALVPALLLAMMQGPVTALLVAGVYTLIQIIQSAVTQPLIQKKMVHIPPALTIVGQVAMGLLGGFWGVLLATPLVALLMTIINKLYVKPQQQHEYPV